MKSRFLIAGLLALCLLSTAAPATATMVVGDLSGDWNTVTANSGAPDTWGYGSDVGQKGDVTGFAAYDKYGPAYLPNSWYYQSAGPSGAPQNAFVPAGGFTDVPVNAVISHDWTITPTFPNRWNQNFYRVPTSGVYTIAGEFWTPADGIHNFRTHDVQVSIMNAGGTLFQNLLSGNAGGAFGHSSYATRQSFSYTQPLVAGQLVLLQERHNSLDGNAFGGFVAQNLTISLVPEPSSIVLVLSGAGLCGALIASRRRRTCQERRG